MTHYLSRIRRLRNGKTDEMSLKRASHQASVASTPRRANDARSVLSLLSAPLDGEEDDVQYSCTYERTTYTSARNLASLCKGGRSDREPSSSAAARRLDVALISARATLLTETVHLLRSPRTRAPRPLAGTDGKGQKSKKASDPRTAAETMGL